MFGYRIELYKFMRIGKQKLREEIFNDKEYKKFLAFGEFDRITFERIHQFSKFRNLSEYAKGWIGDRQIHLVFSLCDTKKSDKVHIINGEFHEQEGNQAVLSNRLFIGLTILQFKDDQKRNCNNIEKVLGEYKNNILEIVEEEKPEVKCSIFGTLGTFGLTIIWLADQYTDILEMVTKIKGDYPVFLSAYTIFAKNHRNSDAGEDKVAAIKGNAIVRLTLRNSLNKDVTQKLNDLGKPDSGFFHCAGEHDVVSKMKSSNVFTLFDKGNALHYGSEFFKNNVLQSYVQFCEDTLISGQEESSEYGGKKDDIVSDDKKSGDESGKDGYKSLEELSKIQREYKDLREIFYERFPSTVGMVDTLDLLYGDYISKVSSESNEMWAYDFSRQFLRIMQCLKGFIQNMSDSSMTKNQALHMIGKLFSDFEWQISHIAQSNNLALGTPVCQFRYSGQNNLTLYAYFGIIKKVLKYVYQAQDKSMQDEIVPLIVTDILPLIESSLYYDYEGSNELNFKIVTINLPMVSLYNPICYLPFLYHEVFHYIVPNDRYRRNRIFGHLLSMEILYGFFMSVLHKKMRSDNVDVQLENDFGITVLQKYVYAFCIEYYDGYIGREIEKLDERILTCEEVSKKVLVSDEFEHKMCLKWLEWLQGKEELQLMDNPLYLFICHIYRQREEIIREVAKWKEDSSGNQSLGIIENAMDGLMEKFAGIADNRYLDTVNENYQKVISEIEENAVNGAFILIDGIREAMADIAMVKLGEMDLPEYLLLFTKTKKDLLLGSSTDAMEQQDIIRIGMVWYFLKGNDSNITETINLSRKKYIYMYCGMYFSSSTYKKNQKYDIETLMQEAETWFDYWKECAIWYNKRYALYSMFLNQLQNEHLVLNKQNACLKECMGGDSHYWKEYARILQEFGYCIIQNKEGTDSDWWKEELDLVQERIFKVNIELIQNNQLQESFLELDKKRKERAVKIKSQEYEKNLYNFKDAKPVHESGMGDIVKYPKYHYWQFDVGDIRDFSAYTANLAKQLKEATRRILGEEEYPIWYRGQQSSEYQLIPSIMRKFNEERLKTKDPDNYSLVKLLRKKFEEFRFRADGTQEALERTGYTDSDYIALMQHHSVISNYLDWTEEVMKAMYFALESFFDKSVTKTHTNAALYIFSPFLYNHARIKMIQRQFEKDPHMLEIDKETYRLTLKEGIPNLSVEFNEEKYNMYQLGLDKFAEDNIIPYDEEKIKEKRAFYLPIAVYVSRLNKRIQAQSGVFLAYNIYTCPDKDYTFQYMSLEEIQKDYLDNFQDDKDTCPFLYKIRIKETGREEIASWVRACGMSKEKCYPELVNIGERVMN